MAARFSPARILRSRRLAVGLIVGIIGYSVVGTLLPQYGGRVSDVAGWQSTHPALAVVTRLLDLHNAYSAPLFLALVGLLTLSTGVCAWERTRASLHAWRSAGRVTPGEAARLKSRPDLVVPVEGLEPAEAMDRTEAALRRGRFAVRRGPALIEASAGRPGLLGSPLFHWTVMLLLVVIALGRLTRADGAIGVPLGGSVVDEASSYGNLHAGPLYPGHSGLRLAASDLVFDFVDPSGYARGPSPVVSLARGAAVVASQRVYPNNPLRYRTLLIHMDGYGMAAVLSAETSSGKEEARTTSLIDYSGSERSGSTSARVDIGGLGSPGYGAIVTVPVDKSGGQLVERLPADQRAEVSLTNGSGVMGKPVTLRVGESLPLTGGYRLKLASLGYYARLSIADDWSIYPIYLLFVAAAAAISLSVFVLYRRVLVFAREDGDGHVLAAVGRHGRGDPLFMARVEETIRQALGQESTHEENA